MLKRGGFASTLFHAHYRVRPLDNIADLLPDHDRGGAQGARGRAREDARIGHPQPSDPVHPQLPVDHRASRIRSHGTRSRRLVVGDGRLSDLTVPVVSGQGLVGRAGRQRRDPRGRVVFGEGRRPGDGDRFLDRLVEAPDVVVVPVGQEPGVD